MGESKIKKLGVGKRMPDDPLFRAGDTLCRMYVREGIVDIDDEQLCHQVVAMFPCELPWCQEVFTSLLDFEMHYNSRHRFFCSQCRKPLPSAHLLDLHLSETHDSFFAAQAERKPMFRCFVEECPVVSQDVSQRRSHCITDHSFPPNFRYDQSFKKNKNTNNKGSAKSNTKNGSEMMAVDETNRPQRRRKQFTFGHQKQGKTFSRGSKPWHAQEFKTKPKNESDDTITTSELMETLPIHVIQKSNN